MQNQSVGRLALRVEGTNWCAYYANPSTMEGAVFLGSIKLGLVQRPDRKQAFMDLMTAVLGDELEELLGERPEWTKPRPAPEAERSGTA